MLECSTDCNGLALADTLGGESPHILRTLQVIADPTLPYCGFGSAKELIDDTLDLFAEVIFVPNHLLPQELRNAKQFEHGNDPETDYKVYGATLGQIGRAMGVDRQEDNDKAEREAALAAHEARIRANEHRWYSTEAEPGETEELAHELANALTPKTSRGTYSIVPE